MGKVSQPVKKAVPKMAMVRAPAAHNYDDFVRLSWDAPEDDRTIILYGQYGAGKSTTALSVSEHFPKTGLPKEKWKGAKPKYICSDMFWFSFDRGATDGFRERGIAVPEFSVPAFMGQEKLWKKAGFAKQPTIMQAVDFGLNLAVKAVSSGARWFVADTISSFDKSLESYWREHMPQSESKDKDDTRAMYGKLFNAHKLFHDATRTLGCGVIYCMHAKALGDTSKMTLEEKRRLISLSAAGLPSLMPDVTGKGAGVYKGDASLQLVIVVKQIPNSKALSRRALTVLQNEWEAKNRFELSLLPEEDADLGVMLRKIRGTA